jgi:uncharacterized repeat protein (TIGR02543 family)
MWGASGTIPAANATDLGNGKTPRYVVEQTGVGRLMKNKTGSSNWTVSSGALQTGSSLFALQTYNAISEIVIYGKGTGNNRTLSKVEVGTATDNYAEVTGVSVTVAGTDDGKFTSSSNADSMHIVTNIAKDSYVAITFSGNVNITSVKFIYASGGGSTYTVTLNPNEGGYASTPTGWTASAGNFTKTVSAGALTIPEPTRASYDFAGWKSGLTAITLTDGKLTVAKDTTLVAQWTPAATKYTVTAQTSTGTDSYGTVSAGDAELAEGETTTITAVPGVGYKVTQWLVSGTGASISPSGESNSNTTTLTMGTANATVTVYFGAATGYTVNHSLTNVTATSGATGADAVYEGNDYSAVFAAADGYTLPATIAVTSGETNITAACTWNSTTGALTIPAASITGTISITVEGEAISYCAELNPATSGDAPAAGDAIDFKTGSYGGSIDALSANLTYTSYGLQFGTNSGTKAQVTLNHLMQEGTVISLTLVANGTGSRGLKLYDAAGSNQVATLGWSSATNGDEQTYTYTVTSSDKLKGTNSFQLWRNNTVTLKSLKVSNCGAELFALSSAVTPANDPAYATVTLNKSLVEAGGSATATYSDIDAAYDFDGWEITSGDATIADATVNPAVITMGTTASTITLKLKVAEVKKTVTYYDNTTELGTELVVVGENPNATGIVAPHKLGYSFAGWSTTNGGAAAALNTIVVADDMPLYAVYNAVNCSALSGKIFEVNINVAPAANCTIRSGSGYETSADLIKYGTVSGGIAIAENSSTSNHLIITTTPTVKFAGGNGYVHISFDCALKVGDKIKTTIASQNIAYTTTSSRSTTNYFTKGTDQELTITSGHPLENATEIYLWAASSNGGELTSLQVIRPEKFEVTFNMHDHGDAVDPQYVIDGGKVTEPATTNITGWDFGGWYKEDTYENEWDFDNDVVSAATELHAKWTEHVLSNNVALGTLTVNGEDVAIVPSQLVYAVELPFGTTAIPTVAATAADANAKACNVTQATAVDGSATIYVKAEDNTTEATYTINFSVATSKDIELVWDKSKERCDATKPDANVLIAAMSEYLSASYTGSAAEGGSLTTGKTTGSKIIITAKPGYAFKAMGFYGKIEDGTCNFYNDGVVETIGTSTGDACYANVFSNDEVHEFVIELTGSNGVYIRNMQLTIIKACTPITIAWDEEPVEFEVGKSGYAIAATASNGGTIAYSSTDDAIVDVVAATGALTISGLGSATLNAATAEGDGTTYCANGGENIEISKVVNTYYLVKFDAQNGDAADEVKYYNGDDAIALPVAPTYAGFDFQGWFDAETGGNQYTAAITPTASMTVYAQWVAQCAGATIDVQPTGASYLTGRTPAALVCEATAGNGGALTYEWFTCDDAMKTNPVAATAMPSTAVAGTFYYFCKVTEAGCDVEAFSDVVTITVADKDPIYLAWVDVTGQNAVALDASKSLYAPEVSAANIKGTSTYDTKTGYKFNSDPAYIAIEGAPFKEGDIVEMFVTSTTADKARVFNANEAVAANVVAEGAANMVQGANKVALTADANNLYLRRGNDFGGWNPYVAYVAVYRTCAPILNKVTVAGVDGTPDNTNHIAIEVPFSTTDDALDAIVYDWVSNNDAWTAAHAPAVANTWEWGVENTVTFADKDGDESVYYVTISKAVASSDATLSALTVNGQAIALVDGVFDYSFELPYGTSVAPTVVATPNHVAAVATVDPCTLSGATITVVPESGAGDQQVYTLTFTISAWKEVAIFDGSYMTDLATSPTDETKLRWEAVGCTGIENWTYATDEPAGKIPAYCSDNDKTYTHVNSSSKNECNLFRTGGNTKNSRYFKISVPKDSVAKVYVVYGSHTEGTEVTMSIGKEASGTATDGMLSLTTDHRYLLSGGMSEILGEGDYYLNATASADFYEIRVYMRPGYARTDMLGNGVLGTVCVPNNVAVEDIQGVTVYELMGREPQYGKIAFDEIVSGELEAGVPYVFQANGDKMVMFYGETKVDDPVDKGNGMYGTFVDQTLTNLDDVYYFAQRALWSCVDLTSLNLPANRAYVKLSEIGEVPSANPAPGRRRITMTVNGEKVATDVENLNASEAPVKLIIDGKMYILRGEKLFDATGRLVK